MVCFCGVERLAYQSSHLVSHKYMQRPFPKVGDKTTKARRHTAEVECEESEALEEYSRKKAVMTLHSADPLTPLPPPPAQHRI